MSKDKRDPDFPSELESQILLRLPEEPAKLLREVLKVGENLKNRLTIQIDNDLRHGEVRFDHWLMHAKIMDLPTVVESLKTIDNKSFYKTADLCQIMLCKDEPDAPPIEEELPPKNKKKDPLKVDKKYLWPHGITPPTKNVRKRRFRKTLKKKYVDAPEVEKEVKRLLRADNEADSVTWEIVKDDDELATPEASTSSYSKSERKSKSERNAKRESASSENTSQKSSHVDDIFGGVLSDSEDDNAVELEDSFLSSYDSHLSDTNSTYGLGDMHLKKDYPTEFESQMFLSPSSKKTMSHSCTTTPSTSIVSKSGGLSSEDDVEYQAHDMSKDNMQIRIDQLGAELEELKQRRKRTQHEIDGMENMALMQRFKDILHTLNQDIMFKEMERQGLITLQTSDDI